MRSLTGCAEWEPKWPHPIIKKDVYSTFDAKVCFWCNCRMSEVLLPQESFAALFGHKQFLNMYMNVNYSKVFIALLHSILMAKIPTWKRKLHGPHLMQFGQWANGHRQSAEQQRKPQFTNSLNNLPQQFKTENNVIFQYFWNIQIYLIQYGQGIEEEKELAQQWSFKYLNRFPYGKCHLKQ